MNKAYVKICMFAFTLVFLLSTPSGYAQAITVLFNCPQPNPPNPPTTYGYVKWSAPKSEPAPVELWESSYGRDATGEQRLGTGYSGESTEIEFNLNTTYIFSLYANNQNTEAPSGTLIAQVTENCNGSSIVAAPIPGWTASELERVFNFSFSSRTGDGNPLLRRNGDWDRDTAGSLRHGALSSETAFLMGLGALGKHEAFSLFLPSPEPRSFDDVENTGISVMENRMAQSSR